MICSSRFADQRCYDTTEDRRSRRHQRRTRRAKRPRWWHHRRMAEAPPALRLVTLCFDAIDPQGQARFWAEALQWDVGGVLAERKGNASTAPSRRCQRMMEVAA